MKKRNILLIISLAALILAGYIFYQKKAAPTKVAIINYPDFILTKMVKSNSNKFIKTTSFKPEQLPSLKSYDMLLIFGMGLKLPAEDQKIIEKAAQSGTKIYLQASTNPSLNLTNVKGKQLDIISDYIDNGGKSNYRNLLNYIRNEVDKKSFFIDSVAPPKEIPSDVLFYKEEDSVFEKIEDFEEYCLEKGFHKKGAKKIAIFTSVPGPFNANRNHINALIDELEKRSLNVYPISAFRGRLNYMKEIKPELIIYMPHGRFSMGTSPKMMQQWLTQQNVPVLCPLSVFQRHEKWLQDKQGMFGGLLSQSVTTPELDGGIVSYAVFAQYEDEKGYLLFKAIPERLKKFGQIVENYINLKDKNNADKKIAVVYFKGPGKNAMVASNMEVLPSLHNLLLHLQKKGYNVGDLPANFESFKKDIMQQGPVLGAYAEGAFEKFLETGNPELIASVDYERWCTSTFPAESYTEVEKKYGKAPGTYMSVYKDTTDYLAVARVQYGNVVLLPQPLPAIGDNQFQLIHGAKIAPIHSYIAPYLWVQNHFKADALFHFGTHGSLEFTPGKQIALSDYDWPDPMIGTIPHYYIYTISNVGEGIIAKRRSYAVTQTYLTPPFIEAQALGEQQSLHQKIHKYDQVSGALKSEYARSIKKMAVKQGIHKDLGLDSILDKPYNEAEMMKLSNYLEEIDHEKITGGLYTMGIPYNEKKLNSTVLMMLINSLSYDLAEIDIQKDVLTRKKIENKRFFNKKYTHPCEKYINRIIKGVNADVIFKEIVSETDINRAKQWKEENEKSNRFGKRKMGSPHQSANKQNDSLVTNAEIKKLKHLIIEVIPQEEKRDYIQKLESDKYYERAISMLDANKRVGAKKMAKMIPAMAKALKIAEDSTVMEIIKLVKKDSLHTLALSFLNDKNLKKEVEIEKNRQDSLLIASALKEENYLIIEKSKQSIKDMQYQDIARYNRLLDFFNDKKERLLLILGKNSKDEAKTLNCFLEKDFEAYKEGVERQIMKLEMREATFSQAVFGVQKILRDVAIKKIQLKNSPKNEFDAVINSLNGGFTPPSSGGDPVSNPETVPTGRNLYSINAEKTPSKESWKVGKKLAESLIEDFKLKHDNAYPKKISFTLWSSSFIETEGTTIAQILYFLGVKPVWGPFGRVRDIRVIPIKELQRPRIDVVVQTSGQLRDLAASRLFLINKAIARVATEDDGKDNYIATNLKASEKSLIDKGFSPQEARNLSKQRVFGGVNGNYGTAIMGMVESSDRWDSTSNVAKTYIKNMGAIYGSQENWGAYQKGAFEAALINTEAVVQPRQSNTWGALSLDHVYEFMGGLNLAIKEVTGNDAESYFNDFRNSSNPRVQGLKEAIWIESRTTLFNPRYINELTKGGASSAETFAETFRNTFGWNVMKPSVIEDRLWNKLYDVYVEDQLDLNLHQFFERENPYALQEMTAVMLETVRKGMWKATPEQIMKMAQLHAELVKKHEAGCSGFVCDNIKLKNFISKKINKELQADYLKEIDKVRESTKVNKKNVVLKKQQNEEKVQQNKKSIFTANKMAITIIILIIVLLIFVFIRKRRKANVEESN